MDHFNKTLAVAIMATGMAAATVQAQTPAPAPAPAPAAAPASPFAFNVALYSQYIFRGLSQTDYRPAVQGGVDYAHPSGFYVGVWGSNIHWLRDFNISSARAEVDIYGGYKTSLGDVGLDVGLLRYQYPGSTKEGATSPNTTEGYVAASYKFATLKYSHAFTNAFGTAESKNSSYTDLTLAIPVVETWTLTAHVGYQYIKGPSHDAATYTDWKLEIAKDFGNGFSAGAAYTGTDAEESFYTPVDKRFIGKHTGYAFVKYVF